MKKSSTAKMDRAIARQEKEDAKQFLKILKEARNRTMSISGKKFIFSCRKFFNKTGFLTDRQIEALQEIDRCERSCYSCEQDDERWEPEDGYVDIFGVFD